MTAPRVDLVKVGLLCRDLATEVGSLDFTGDELCALADLIEKAKAFLDRVVALQPKINSCTQIAGIHGCHPFGMKDNWADERDALAALFEEKG